MATHEIEVILNGIEAEPPKSLPDMKFGETVHYFSSSGIVTIVFPDISPFRTDDAVMTAITSTDTPSVARKTAGSFPCRCFIRRPNGTTAGWRADPSPSGGVHNVKP